MLANFKQAMGPIDMAGPSTDTRARGQAVHPAQSSTPEAAASEPKGDGSDLLSLALLNEDTGPNDELYVCCLAPELTRPKLPRRVALHHPLEHSCSAPAVYDLHTILSEVSSGLEAQGTDAMSKAFMVYASVSPQENN